MGRVTALVILGLILSGCGFVPGSGGLAGREGSSIRYEVTGGGTAGNVTYMMGQGQQQETQVPLPWSKQFTAGSGFQSFVVTAQNGGGGSINCRITADGKTISSQTSTGEYAVVTCSAT